jgi:molybdopterin-containing oxidoreductase family iron-sulfur binding subunit
VKRRKASPLDYALLADLNTRPRTTYLGRIVNPAAGIGEQPVRAGDGAADEGKKHER